MSVAFESKLNKFQRKIEFENVLCQMVAIVSQPQCVKAILFGSVPNNSWPS